MQSGREKNLETVLKLETDSAWELLSQLNQFLELLWEHYKYEFMEKLTEENLPSLETDIGDYPF